MKYPFLTYIFVILLASVFLTGCTNRDAIDKSASLVDEALILYENREYKAAIEKFGEALEEYPSNTDAYVGIVTALLDKGYMSEAIDVAEEASLRLSNEDSALIYIQIGNKYVLDGDYEKAEEIYIEAANQDNSLYEVRIALGELYIKKGDLEKANEELDALSGRDRDKHEYLLLKSYLMLTDWSKGSELLNRIDLNSVTDETVKEQVRVLREIYSSEDLEDDSLHKNTHLAKEYINAGYPYLAIEMFDRQSDNIDEYWDAQYFWGKAYFDHGDYENALKKLNNAAALDVDDVGMFLSLGRTYLMLDNIDRALNGYNRAISVVNLPDERYVVEEYVEVLIDNNMLNSARTMLLEIAQEHDYPWIYSLLCRVSYEQKNINQMKEYAQKIESYQSLTSGEERELVRCRLLYSLEDINDENEIPELLEKYKGFDEHNPEVFFLEAKFLAHNLQNEAAIEALNRAIELDLEGKITDEARKMLATIK